MSRFYSRYVPPTAKVDAQATDATDAPDAATKHEKRKRKDDIPKVHKSKKLKISESSPRNPSATETTTTTAVIPQGSQPKKRQPAVTGNNVLDKYRVTEAAKSTEASINLRSQRSQHYAKRDDRIPDEPHESKLATKETKKGKMEKARKVSSEDAEQGEDGTHLQKHATVLSKFEKAIQQDQQDLKSVPAPEQPAPELHGLEPIPQPEQRNIIPEKPSYSIRPPWQENPTFVPQESSTAFDALPLPVNILHNLKKQDLLRALPIQATVLSLLLNGESRHAGDLCVSAATGSGKTLSYVLPIISEIQEIPGTQLRAVIVVPTRELVKQVREHCEVCAAGTSLKFAAAVGSKSLAEEQEMLVKREEIFDLKEYEKRQQDPIDWSSFSLSKLAQRTKVQDPLTSVGYITRYRSKVDVLITTPGRLVDHIKSTEGFTLDHVTWLVVDEADRLLNESYQEWVAVVKPALESQNATKARDELLRHMRMSPPKRKLTKILLSATMTRDLSKLDALGLQNPKLVVLAGSTEVESIEARPSTTEHKVATSEGKDGKDTFHLPDSLTETAIPITDGSEKPLYLLKLLTKYIGLTSNTLTHYPNAGMNSTNAGLDADTISDSSSGSELSSSSDDESSDSDSSSDPKKAQKPKLSTSADGVNRAQGMEGPRVLVFTRSTASAERLARLLGLLEPGLAPRIGTLTRSTASSASSRRALASFRSAKISILIATDRASRGLDVPNLEHVVSYDVPNSALTYVHRVGRAARAGRVGQAWTFIEHREAAWFWRQIGGKGRQTASGIESNEVSIRRKAKVVKFNISSSQEALKQRYSDALKQLGEEVLGS